MGSGRCGGLNPQRMSEAKLDLTPSQHVVIVGAGHAGGSAAAFLRQHGYIGSISLIGAEPLAPYQRPPLSKAWLAGAADEDTLQLRPFRFYADHNIGLRLDTRVDSIDRQAGRVNLTGGASVPYDRLILATGARARAAPFAAASLKTVLELRTAADAEKLKQALRPGARLVIVGGGYVGLEAAASARALGVEVTVVEREPRLLARVACVQLSEFFARYHRLRGVTLRLGRSVASIEEHSGQPTIVSLDDGNKLAADRVLVGVGAVPNQELAFAAGLPCDDGVVVDTAARTADPRIHAIGDCTRRPIPRYGRQWRLESVSNALEQARQAAAAICAKPPPPAEIPWFWSDQFDSKLQIAGLPIDVIDVVVRGDPHSNRFAVFHIGAGGRLQSVEAINAAPEFMMGRQLISVGRKLNLELLRNPDISMKEVAI